MLIRRIEIEQGGDVLEATVALPSSQKKKLPIVFIFHSWEGKGPFAEKKAIALADLGYIGCALDLYGKGKFGKNREECSQLVEPFFANRAKLLERILSYRAILQKTPEADASKIAAIGFCFGGLCALDLARSGSYIKGVVSFHGLLAPPENLVDNKISSKILVLHGGKDPMVSKKQVCEFSEEMEGKGVDFQIHIFGKSMHAFTNPEANDPGFGTLYDEDADRRSGFLMQSFLEEVFA